MTTCQHRAWRRSRAVRWVVSKLYTSGIASTGGGYQWSAECSYCLWVLPRFRGRRHYVLGIETDHWRCVLKYHHIPGDPIAFGMCSKCLPCPDCGSQTAGHLPGCPA